ncbi:Protein EXORDIUM-like [Dillenia turbinata]|uniref:Protein EXORDIUM-like n=1 Tax=Dillenia turbinata TaxID=194707 RepID=A0AAN8VP05_9MAGN
MIIANILVGAAANPFKNRNFQGDALAALGVVSACPRISNSGAYPGYPGNLMMIIAAKLEGVKHLQAGALWRLKRVPVQNSRGLM